MRAHRERPLRHPFAMVGALALPAIAGACQGTQHILDPKGPQASHIAEIWWVMLAVATVVVLLVLAAAGYAIWHRRPTDDDETARHPAEASATEGDRGRAIVIAWAVGATAVILVSMVVYSVYTGRKLASLAQPNALTIEVIGHQWWWEIRYKDSLPSKTFVTANEIHVPVGRPVRLLVRSADVIHSFWVPNLHGKVDLIPGRENTLWLQADEPGEWRGQCAEYCGLQHTRMALVMVASDPIVYEAWAAAQRLPAVPATDPVAAEGQRVFETTTCAMCHTVRGTLAHGKVAPDLTHIAGRRMLAAGTIPNTRGHMAGWILDPQQVKPGNFMPSTDLDPDSFHALLHWLGTLQ